MKSVECAVICTITPVVSIGLCHTDFPIETSGAGELVSQTTVVIIPPLRINQVHRFDIGDDNRSKEAIGFLKTDILAIEHLKNLACNFFAHVTHFNCCCHKYLLA